MNDTLKRLVMLLLAVVILAVLREFRFFSPRAWLENGSILGIITIILVIGFLLSMVFFAPKIIKCYPLILLVIILIPLDINTVRILNNERYTLKESSLQSMMEENSGTFYYQSSLYQDYRQSVLVVSSNGGFNIRVLASASEASVEVKTTSFDILDKEANMYLDKALIQETMPDASLLYLVEQPEIDERYWLLNYENYIFIVPEDLVPERFKR